MVLLLASAISAGAEDNAPGGSNTNSAQTQPAVAPSDTDELKPQTPDTDLFALMTGPCSTLR